MGHRFIRLALCAALVCLSVPTISVAAPRADSDADPGPVFSKGAGAAADGDGREGISALADSIADATPLTPSPVAGTLPAQGDSVLYSIALEPGQRIELSLTGTGGAFDVYLYPPATDLLEDALAVAHATEGSYPRRLAYDVPSYLSGTYYIEVYAYSGAGSYSLSWLVREPGENTRTDIDAATALPVPGATTVTLANAWGANRVFKVRLNQVRRVQVDLAGPANADFDVYLYAPGVGTILPWNTRALGKSNSPTSNERLIYDVPAGATGEYYLEVLRFNGSGTATLQVSEYPIPPAPATTRMWGADRYATAAAISARSFPAGSQSVVLASGRAFPDGLTSSALAGALHAPVLLTQPTGLPVAAAAELRRLGARTIYIVGGTAAVGTAVESDILGQVPGTRIVRVAGPTRYETAAAVADKVHEVSGRRSRNVFLASGETFPDALSFSPVAYSTRTPIILTRPASLPEASRAAILRMRGSETGSVDLLVAGGTAAVSDNAAGAAAYAAGGAYARAAGATRYGTALAVAEHAVFAGWADPETVAVASGAGFPDALAGASLPGKRGGTLLLSAPATLSSPAEAYLRSFDFAVNECWVLGGAAAVGDPVIDRIRTVLPDEPRPY